MELEKNKKGYVFINLLPFREQIKKEKVNQFYVLCGLFGVASLFVGFLVYSMLLIQVDNQKSRNKYIEGENKKLDGEIKKIANLQTQINETLEKRNVVERLQINRGDIVNILNDVAGYLPEGMTLTEINTKMVNNQDQIVLKGTTNSNNKVSTYMTQLASSGTFINPVLVEIKALGQKKSDDGANQPVNNSFHMTLILKPSIATTDVKDTTENTDTSSGRKSLRDADGRIQMGERKAR